MATPKLDEILRDLRLSEKALDRPCTADHARDFALHITSWQSLAPFIGITDVDEEEIREDAHNARNQKLKLMTRWRQKLGRNATYLHLAKGLAAIERRDLIEKLCEIAGIGGQGM